MDTDLAAQPAPEPVAEADIDAIDAQLDDVERSLARIDAGTYGRCEACGTLIDDAELAVDPNAARCGGCRSVDTVEPVDGAEDAPTF
jgi:RNA polymerase-binding transcription factor DksA